MPNRLPMYHFASAAPAASAGVMPDTSSPVTPSGALIAEAGRVAGFAPPIYEIINTLAKVIRIRSLTPYLSRGELRFKRGSRGAIALVDQLVAFPSADYDDGPDALEMCVRLARHLITGAELKAIPSIRGR